MKTWNKNCYSEFTSESSTLSEKKEISERSVFFHGRNKSKMINMFGFTLVELIVVITILTILGTIGFIQLSGFTGSARDSDRVTTLKNIDSWLVLFQIKTGSYPMPEADGTIGVLTGSINGITYAYKVYNIGRLCRKITS